MKFYFSLVCAPDPHTQRGRLARTPSGSFCWDKDDPNESDYAVLAKLSNGQLVGIQKFNVRQEASPVLESGATYVWPMYREMKIAKRMWAFALAELDISKVEVHVVSDRGKTLVDSLQSEFPDVSFQLDNGSKRKLRDLRGKGKRKLKAA